MHKSSRYYWQLPNFIGNFTLNYSRRPPPSLSLSETAWVARCLVSDLRSCGRIDQILQLFFFYFSLILSEPFADLTRWGAVKMARIHCRSQFLKDFVLRCCRLMCTHVIPALCRPRPLACSVPIKGLPASPRSGQRRHADGGRRVGNRWVFQMCVMIFLRYHSSTSQAEWLLPGWRYSSHLIESSLTHLLSLFLLKTFRSTPQNLVFQPVHPEIPL